MLREIQIWDHLGNLELMEKPELFILSDYLFTFVILHSFIGDYLKPKENKRITHCRREGWFFIVAAVSSIV